MTMRHLSSAEYRSLTEAQQCEYDDLYRDDQYAEKVNRREEACYVCGAQACDACQARGGQVAECPR